MYSTQSKFGTLRAFFWPIHRFELKKFVPLFVIYALICLNYTILRATKDTLVITASGSGAEILPYIKVWVILPMALLFTFLFTLLANKFSQEKVFYIMMSVFIGFFILFSTVLYPLRDFLHPHEFADSLELLLPQGLKGLISILRNWTFTLYYVMSEMWSTTIMSVLFWGFANQITSIKDAKRFYGLLGVGANIATMASGQITIFCAKPYLISWLPGTDVWGQSLTLITLLVIAVALITVAIFRWYHKNVITVDIKLAPPKDEVKVKMGLKKNFTYLAKSKYLICIAIIVIAYNLAINMMEIVWKDQVNLLFPLPTDYLAYMGKVTMFMGALSTLIGLFICGNVIQKCGWTAAAIITPTILLATGVLFFSSILLKNQSILSVAAMFSTTPLAMTVFLGSLQNCLSRASKFTFFDATKEISFIPLSNECKLKGKAAIDGIGSRLGKSGGSLFHQSLLLFFGSISMSTPYVAIFLLLALAAYVVAVRSLGKQFDALAASQETIKIQEDPAPALVTQEALV
ncbi:MAG: NTP/NDP exchange transporter [Simkaniaceae bacterium]|nr:NTP/NDP exchange transporter [Simkaniaceae bacterium]